MRADHAGCATLEGWLAAGDPVRYVCVWFTAPTLADATDVLYGCAVGPAAGNLTTDKHHMTYSFGHSFTKTHSVFLHWVTFPFFE